MVNDSEASVDAIEEDILRGHHGIGGEQKTQHSGRDEQRFWADAAGEQAESQQITEKEEHERGKKEAGFGPGARGRRLVRMIDGESWGKGVMWKEQVGKRKQVRLQRCRGKRLVKIQVLKGENGAEGHNA